MNVAFEQEVQYWKVPNFLKDVDEINQIKEYLKEHLVYLRNLFIVRSSNSMFPCIKSYDFHEFV